MDKRGQLEIYFCSTTYSIKMIILSFKETMTNSFSWITAYAMLKQNINSMGEWHQAGVT